MNAIRHETDRYRLETERNGLFYTLTRKTDGKTAFFQGDDADLWDRNMDALEAVEKWGPAFPRGLGSAFDHLCSGYDEVLS